MLAYTPIAMMSSPWIPRVQVKHFTLMFPEEILHSYLVHHPTLTSHLGMSREPRESRAKAQIFRRKELLRSWSKHPRATKLRQLQKRPPELGYCLEFPFVFFLQNRKLFCMWWLLRPAARFATARPAYANRITSLRCAPAATSLPVK